jgi:hypothetical protein
MAHTPLAGVVVIFKVFMLKEWIVTLAAIIVTCASSPALADRIIIIVGKGGQAEYTKKFSGYAEKLERALTSQLGYQQSQIIVLSESSGDSASHVQRAFDRLAGIAADEQVTVIYFGHGTYDGQWAKLNLSGPDLRDLDLAAFLDRLPARQQIVLHTGAASGPFVEKLSRAHRVIITATRSGDENHTTIFPEYFIEALTAGSEADLDKNGEISLLEAFDYTRDRVVRFYEDAKRLRPEHPLLDDNGDGEGSETPSPAGSDGRLASKVYLKARTSVTTVVAEPAHPLLKEKAALLDEIEAFKARKTQLPDAEYRQKLEELFIRLARLNRQIKTSAP